MIIIVGFINESIPILFFDNNSDILEKINVNACNNNDSGGKIKLIIDNGNIIILINGIMNMLYIIENKFTS